MRHRRLVRRRSAAPIKAMWFRGGWFDSISVLWREVSTGQFRANDGAGAEEATGRNGGSLLLEGSLAPGESVTCRSSSPGTSPTSTSGTAPHRPNPAPAPSPSPPTAARRRRHVVAPPLRRPVGRRTAGGPVRRRALRVASRPAPAFADALWDSTLPRTSWTPSPRIWPSSSRRPSCARRTATFGPGKAASRSRAVATAPAPTSGTTRRPPHLFPALERTLREQELERSMDERGHVQFRAALPDGPTRTTATPPPTGSSAAS